MHHGYFNSQLYGFLSALSDVPCFCVWVCLMLLGWSLIFVMNFSLEFRCNFLYM